MNGEEFYHSEIIKDFISKIKKSDMDFFPDEDQGINYEEKIDHALSCFNEKVCEKSYDYFHDILKKDYDDYFSFLRCRINGPRQLPYSDIIYELMIFTALRYHEDHFEDFIRKLLEGMHPRYLMMGISKMRGDYAEAFKKKGKGKKGV